MVWDGYVKTPSHQNAVKVYEQLPGELIGNDHPDERLTNKVYQDWDQTIGRKATSDKDVLRIGFRLFTISDGAFGEDLGIDIGKLITLNPRLFLQELKSHRHLIVSLGGLVGNYGEEYVDRLELRLIETKKRIKSLESISDSDLIKTRDECLAELRNQ